MSYYCHTCGKVIEEDNRTVCTACEQSSPVLQWEFDDQGEWEAASSMKDSDGDALFRYRIQVCADGSFDVTASDKELGISKRETLGSLGYAKTVCELRELMLVAARV